MTRGWAAPWAVLVCFTGTPSSWLLSMQVNDAMLKEDRRWLSDRQRLNATFSMFIKRMESLVRRCSSPNSS